MPLGELEDSDWDEEQARIWFEEHEGEEQIELVAKKRRNITSEDSHRPPWLKNSTTGEVRSPWLKQHDTTGEVRPPWLKHNTTGEDWTEEVRPPWLKRRNITR